MQFSLHIKRKDGRIDCLLFDSKEQAEAEKMRVIQQESNTLALGSHRSPQFKIMAERRRPNGCLWLVQHENSSGWMDDQMFVVAESAEEASYIWADMRHGSVSDITVIRVPTPEIVESHAIPWQAIEQTGAMLWT